MREALLGAALLLLADVGASFAQAPSTDGAAAVLQAPSGSPPAEGYAPDASWAGRDAGGQVLWGDVDYLLWWVKSGPLPPFLILTGDPNTPNPGALNAGGRPVPSTSSLDFGALSGVRATVGGWLDSEGRLGIEGSGFLLPQSSKSFRLASDASGNPVLGFRYLDTPGNPATPLAEDVFQASIPPGNPFGLGPFAGSLAVVSELRLWGSEANAVFGLVNDGTVRLQGLVGFRYADLTEDLSLQLHSAAVDGAAVMFLGTPFPAPAAFTTTDFFRTRNQFYGGQLGLRGQYDLGNFLIAASGKIALGSNHEVVEVAGNSTLLNAGPVVSVPVGQFAGPSNIGRRTRDEFAAIPEIEFKLGYRVTSWLNGWIGYDFLYMTRVVRPGNQVDLFVNDSTNPVNGVFGLAPLDKTAFPRAFFERTDFWAQGLTFGIELRY